MLAAASCSPAQSPPQQEPQSFKFRTGVELINVNATVTDQSGRFVSGLNKDDFRVFDDEQPQTVTHFNAERVPVSLGIVLDTSGSMDGDKMYAAKQALERFLFQLLDPDDEVFLYRFDNQPELVEGWTRDKRRVSESLQPHPAARRHGALRRGRRRRAPRAAGPQQEEGRRHHLGRQRHEQPHRRLRGEAVDPRDRGARLRDRDRRGRPTAAATAVRSIRVVRSSCSAASRRGRSRCRFPCRAAAVRRRRRRRPCRSRRPAGRRRRRQLALERRGGSDDRVNVAALRDITDDSGGRTEIVRWTRDLDPARPASPTN